MAAALNPDAFVRKPARPRARLLRQRGKPQPVRLFSSGARAPHLGISIAGVESMDDDVFVEPMHQAYAAPIAFLRHPEGHPAFRRR